MILFILTAIIIAKVKGYKNILKNRWLYPLYIVELIYIIVQINFILGNYYLLDYSQLIQIAFILSMLPAIIKYSLNIPATIGAGLVILGTVMNGIVMKANDGFMPVYPTLSKLTGYFSESMMNIVDDGRHILATAETKLFFLADYIDIGWTIYSPGDILNHSFVTIIMYYTIKKANNSPLKGQI